LWFVDILMLVISTLTGSPVGIVMVLYLPVAIFQHTRFEAILSSSLLRGAVRGFFSTHAVGERNVNSHSVYVSPQLLLHRMGILPGLGVDPPEEWMAKRSTGVVGHRSSHTAYSVAG
jgi:hypothetical protein